MIFPKGKVIFENLKTSFTNFDELLSNLKDNKTSCYIAVTFWEYEGVLFISSGEIISALEEKDSYRKIGAEAVMNLLKKVKEKEGTISIYEIPPELVMLLAGSSDSIILYKDLASDFTDLKKLIEKLRAEKHTGYMEIVDKLGENVGVIFIQAGEPMQSILTINKEVILHSGVHPRIYELVQTNGAIFNVFKSGLLINGNNGEEISRLLEFWSDVIACIEKRSNPTTFNSIFRKALIAKADAYPFLDPFMAEFNYANGKATFVGNISINFNKGIGEVLRSIILLISNSDINSEFNKIKKAHKETIEKYDLEGIFEDLYK